MRTDTWAIAMLNGLFRSAAIPRVTNLYLGILLADPVIDGVVEVPTLDTGYARIAIPVADASWTAPADDGTGRMRSSNVSPQTYGTPLLDWGTPWGWGLFAGPLVTDALWFYDIVTGEPRPIFADDIPPGFAAGSLKLSIGDAATDWLETALLNQVLRTATIPKPGAHFVALHSDDPTDIGAANEVTAASYTRVSFPAADASWTVPAVSGGSVVIANAVQALFPEPTDAWGTVRYLSVRDAASGGNAWAQGALGQEKTVNAGDNPPPISIGALTISL